jgi:hypothetical protein
MKKSFPLLLAALCALASVASLHAQNTAFTYQGRLQHNGAPANGSFDLRFIPFNAGDGGSHAGPILTNRATAVIDGLFTVFVDFGGLSFLGTNYWLEIAARTNGVAGFVTLAPRQPITSVPQATASATAITALRLAGVAQHNFVDEEDFAAVGGGRDNVGIGYASAIAGMARSKRSTTRWRNCVVSWKRSPPNPTEDSHEETRTPGHSSPHQHAYSFLTSSRGVVRPRQCRVTSRPKHGLHLSRPADHQRRAGQWQP